MHRRLKCILAKKGTKEYHCGTFGSQSITEVQHRVTLIFLYQKNNCQLRYKLCYSVNSSVLLCGKNYVCSAPPHEIPPLRSRYAENKKDVVLCEFLGVT